MENKEQNEKLIIDIETIINQGLDKAAVSNEIMERIRNEYIFLRDHYFHSFKWSPNVTIDPESECVKFTLGEQDLLEDYVKIYAYSFGPFNPEEYFKADTFRISWLLKEPYMQSGDLDKYKNGEYRYLGGHDQAKEYADYFRKYKNLGNSTFDNLIKFTRTILLSLGKILENTTDEDILGHICILEANHFPGLAFKSTNSNDGLIRKWAEKNVMILKELIDFYQPNILIGGNTIGHFYNISDHDINSLKKSIKNGNKELLSSIGINVHQITKSDDSSSYVFKASLDSNNKPLYVIDSYHPNKYKNTEAEADAKVINELNSRNETGR